MVEEPEDKQTIQQFSGPLSSKEHAMWRGQDTVYLDQLQPVGEDKPVKVVLDGRDGNMVFVRRVDPSDVDPERVPIHPGEEVLLMTALSHAGLAMTEEVGRKDDLLTAMRIVPVERRGNHVFGRVLGFGEQDHGRRVHLRPEDSFTLSGKGIAQLDLIDSHSRPDETGYAPLADTVWTWLRIVRFSDEGQFRYVIAAARRLDSAQRAFRRVATLRSDLEQLLENNAWGVLLRATTAELVGEIEAAVIALARAINMITAAPKHLQTARDLPESLLQARRTVTEIRNAYEHIDDRAFGRIKNEVHADALTIFDNEELFRNNRITYGHHSLDLENEGDLLMSARDYLKRVTADLTVSPNNPPVG
jgi:hypothetical protein